MLTLNNPWLLAASFFLHLIATVVWIGGLVTMALVVWPGLRRAVREEAALAPIIETLDARFKPLANLSLAALIITGLIQMNASPLYNGLLNLSNVWAQAIFFKHISIIGMIGVGALMNFGVQPALQRHALLLAAGAADAAEAAHLHRRLNRLTQLNLALGIVVLVLTAIARAQ
ncbi:MAG TPA: CopD family protein [Anaerolineae bacterium]|nr:CopD family protein [Anaerolineae bacterium]